VLSLEKVFENSPHTLAVLPWLETCFPEDLEPWMFP
jgi:hypothetical protein